MPTKHIDNEIWKKIQEWTVYAVIETKKPIKEAQILEFLINKGIKNSKKEDLKTIT